MAKHLFDRYACRCKLCKQRWMTTLSRAEAYRAHGEICQAYQDTLSSRLAYSNFRTVEGEVYQMAALYFEWRQVEGTYNPAVRCDARCQGAKRHSCECSCGGRNHGAGVG